MHRVAHPEVHREVLAHAPRVLREEIELAHASAVDPRAEVAVLIRGLVEDGVARDRRDAASENRVEPSRVTEVGRRRALEIRRAEHRTRRIARIHAESDRWHERLIP